MIGRLKTAAEVEAEQGAELAKHELVARNREVLKSIGAGALGLGAGTAAGYLATKGVDSLMRRGGGAGIPPQSAARWIAPLAVGGMGMAMGSWRAHQDAMMRQAAEEQQRARQNK